MAGLSNKTLLWKLYVWIDFENGLFYCYFALSAMEKYLVESLLKWFLCTYMTSHTLTNDVIYICDDVSRLSADDFI